MNWVVSKQTGTVHVFGGFDPDGAIVTLCSRRYGPSAGTLQKQALRIAPRCLTCMAVYRKRQ